MEYHNQSTAPYRKILRFLSQSGTLQEGSTDAQIARSILANADHMSRLTIEGIANDSLTSISSVSRFFVKMGFDDYKEFKTCAAEYFGEIGNYRLKSAYKQYGRMTISELSDSIRASAMNNLQNTQEKFNEKSIEQIVKCFRNCKNIWFIGDEKELNTAKVLQLDLLVNHHGTYLLNINDFHEELFRCEQMENAAIVFLNVYSEWYGKEMVNYAAEANRAGIQCILFAQDEELNLPDGNITYHYGISGSINDGCYSLEYLCQLLSKCLYLMD